MTDKEARRILLDIADQMPSDVCADWIDAISVGVKAIDAQQTKMRDATEEECKSVKDYIKSISKPTGVRFDAQLTDAKETIIKSALKYLVKMQIEEGSVGFAVDNDPDHDCYWNDVLAWLEAQPCRNCISREESIEGLTELINNLKRIQGDMGAAVNSARELIKTLPSTYPERPRGEWIKVDDEEPIAYDCSECGSMVSKKYNYCPECGADMNGGEKMQLVIEIPDELYDDYKTIPKTEIDDYGALIDRAIYYGTPLPKGHGELVDRDAINDRFYDIWKELESYSNKPTYKKLLDRWSMCMDTAQPIVEADRGEEDEDSD